MGLFNKKFCFTYCARESLFSKMINDKIYIKAKDKYAAEKLARKILNQKYRIFGLGEAKEVKDDKEN